MKRRILLILSGFFLAISFLGCASTPTRFYVPEPVPIEPRLVLNPEFNVDQTVDLINAQTFIEDVEIGAYTHAWMGNLRLWTESAVALLKTELKKRGYTVTVNASTVFQVSVVEKAPSDQVAGYIQTDIKKTGCPLDTDKDGVPDFMDKCSGTPLGVEVDKNGCPRDSDKDRAPDFRDQCPGETKDKPAKKKPSAKPKTVPVTIPRGPGIHQFTITSKLPSDAVIQILKTEMGKRNMALAEIGPNVFKFPVAMEQWTSASEDLTAVLEERDIVLTNGAPQVLWLSVTGVSLYWGFRDVRCTVDLNVRTADEHVRDYRVTGMEHDLYPACDWAVSKAVASLFMPPPPPKDTDRDGVIDDEDACPDTPEGVDVDKKGCPLDSDEDGVPDYKDQCPKTPKGVGVNDAGCPLDSDEDGVPDYRDQCPETPKGARVDAKGCASDMDKDGVPDYKDQCPRTSQGTMVDSNGCPVDTDKDGVPDADDECPNTPKGVKVNKRGCPFDADEDGVADYKDQCPGTPKGAKANAEGCWVVDDALFDLNEAKIKPKFFPLLDQIARVLKNNPSLKIEIQGHTDNTGSNEYNQNLSAERVKAVRDYLVKKGISDNRLFPVGYGSLKPKASNKTEAGRALNRRVELVPVQ